jgi:putative hydrolase of the HAD superfamily
MPPVPQNSLDVIFFDAGNTLVFPDLNRTLAPLNERGIDPTRAQLHAAERAARRRRDECAANGAARLNDEQYWQLYHSMLLASLGVDDPALRDALVACSRRSVNWEFVLPGTRTVLAELQRKYRLGVISNADGHIGELLDRVGLGGCFEVVIDSGNVGIEKPDVRIFRAALDAMKVEPAAAIYIGDVYSIDYLGAQNAGMRAMLFDVCGAYADGNLDRVESLEELRDRLLANAG